GVDEGTQNYSLDHIFAGTNPSVLVDKIKSAGDGLKTTHTDLGTNEESRSDVILKKIKLEDLLNLMQDTRSAFFSPDSLEDEPIIITDESEEEETKRYEDTHATSHDELEDTSVPHPPSPKSVQLQKLMAQVLLLQSQKLKLEQQKEKAKAEVAFLKAQPLYPDVNQLTELLVTSLKPELSKLLASHDFASCLPTELKELPLKITELSGEVKELKKHVRDMEIELPGDLKDIPKKLDTFASTVSSLTSQVTDTLNKFANIVENASSKATDKSVPSAGHAIASPTKGENNTNQATKDANNANLKQQPTTKTPPTTSSFESPLFPKSKGNKVMSSKDAEDEEIESDFEDDHTNPADSMVESSKQKKLKNLNFVTEGGEKIYFNTEKIEEQKRIKETLKDELAKQEVEKVKNKLVDLMGIDVVTQYYNKKLMYDKYCEKMLKRRKSSKITNCDVLTKKGPNTLKVYRKDETNEVISNFKVSDLPYR
ncbi:hypothetical protein Tco_0731428, partial [Tanacetum coccineum]